VPPFTSTPSSALRPVPTATAAGVARPSAQGQAITSTATNRSTAAASPVALGSTIDSALREVGGVDKADVRLREGTVVVQHDPAHAHEDALIEAVRGAGYQVRSRAA
jgi:copper chaperone